MFGRFILVLAAVLAGTAQGVQLAAEQNGDHKLRYRIVYDGTNGCATAINGTGASAGAGTLGLPKLKSKTFSAPISAARALLYSKISLIIERLLPSAYIFSLYPIIFTLNIK